MQVILLERVAKLGQMGDVVTVKDGYARNYLLPQKKALWASEANIASFEADKAQLGSPQPGNQERGRRLGRSPWWSAVHRDSPGL